MSNSMDRPVVIFGTGELAQLAHFYFTHDSARQVAGFTVDAEYIDSPEYLGLPLVPSLSLEESFSPQDFDLFVAIGYKDLNRFRAERCVALMSRGYSLASYISSRASIWPGLTIGDNCMIMEGNVIQPFAKIGNGVIIFCNSIISHHAELGDYCFIGSEATVSGGVKIGANSFVGVNATIREHVSIGRDSLIGAGTLILKDTADNSSYLEPGSQESGVSSLRMSSLL